MMAKRLSHDGLTRRTWLFTGSVRGDVNAEVHWWILNQYTREERATVDGPFVVVARYDRKRTRNPDAQGKRRKITLVLEGAAERVMKEHGVDHEIRLLAVGTSRVGVWSEVLLAEGMEGDESCRE